MTTTNGTGPSVIVQGVVEQRNEHGIKVDGEWRNASKFRPVELPGLGARVRCELDGKGFIKSIDVIEPSMTIEAGAEAHGRDRRISRLAVLKAAAAFSAGREGIKSADVLKIADAWLAWVEQGAAE